MLICIVNVLVILSETYFVIYNILKFVSREHAPSIIFMDEIDSIGSSRLEGGSGGWYLNYSLPPSPL